MCRYDSLPEWCLPHARAPMRWSEGETRAKQSSLYHIWMPFGLGTGLRSRAMAEKHVFPNHHGAGLQEHRWFKVDRGRLYLCGTGVSDGDQRPSVSVHELDSFEQAVKWLRMANEMVGDRYGDSR